MTAAIALIPVGGVPADLIPWLPEKLVEVVGRRVITEPAISLPLDAYDPDRGQYRSDAVLAELRGVKAPEAERVVGLVEANCFAPGLNFVFGAAEGGGREALVALPRLRESFYGLSEDPALFRMRVLKEVLHELGHTWNLGHCAEPGCVMRFSMSLEDTDSKGPGFCRTCEARLRRGL